MFFFLQVYSWKIVTNNCAFHKQMKETLDALILLSNEKVCVFLVVESIYALVSLTNELIYHNQRRGQIKKVKKILLLMSIHVSVSLTKELTCIINKGGVSSGVAGKEKVRVFLLLNLFMYERH